MHISKPYAISQIDGADDEVEEVISKVTQTDESCHYCKESIECLDKHNISGLCPKNKAAQNQALWTSEHWSGQRLPSLPPWMINSSQNSVLKDKFLLGLGDLCLYFPFNYLCGWRV